MSLTFSVCIGDWQGVLAVLWGGGREAGQFDRVSTQQRTNLVVGELCVQECLRGPRESFGGERVSRLAEVGSEDGVFHPDVTDPVDEMLYRPRAEGGVWVEQGDGVLDVHPTAGEPSAQFAVCGDDEELKIGCEAGVGQGWFEAFGLDAFIGMSTFGASAPGKDAFAHFGITAEAIVETAKALL